MLEQSFTADDAIESLTTQQLKQRLEGESALPGGFYLALIDGVLIIYRLALINSAEPRIHASVTVRSDLTVVTRVDGREVPSDKDLLPAARQTMSQLLNLMARVKVWCEDEQSKPPSLLLKTAR